MEKKHHMLQVKVTKEKFSFRIQLQEKSLTGNILLTCLKVMMKPNHIKLFFGSIGGVIICKLINHMLSLVKKKVSSQFIHAVWQTMNLIGDGQVGILVTLRGTMQLALMKLRPTATDHVKRLEFVEDATASHVLMMSILSEK